MGSRLESNSEAVRKRIEKHSFDDEAGEEYGASAFGGFTDYFRRKKIKLQNLDAERRRLNADKPQIFRGVVAHVNGYTQPSLNDLHAMIVDHGGGFLQYLDGKTMATHVIASNLTPKKAVEFRKYRIVKPAWVVDSLAAGKLLPWNDYRVIDEGTRQNVLAFQNGSITSQANNRQRGYRSHSDTSWYTDQIKDHASRVDGREGTSALASSSSLQQPANPASHGSTVHSAGSRVPVEDFDIPQSSLTSSFGLSGLDDNDLLQVEGDLWDNDDNVADEDKEDLERPLHSPGDMEPAPAGLSPAEARLKEKMPEHQVDLARSQATPTKKPSTAEEHNAVLLADPKIWKSTVVNPNFLKQYYEESRLHHLSTWKAELKSKLQAHAQELSMSQKARQKRPAGSRRYVLHVDFDCFFAAVSLKKHPEYQDKPTVVAHGSGTGAEIASCNYPARKHGVKNGMWMKNALELCPDLKVLPYEFKAYEEASRQFYAAIMDLGGVVQSVSIDEALVDISVACIEAGGGDGKTTNPECIQREQSRADEIADGVREKIKADTGCAVSVGIGNNILLAKLSLRKAKPAGQYHVKPPDVLDFIAELSVRDLPGVAWSLGRKLEELGVKVVKDVRELTKERLMNALGPKTGQKLWEYARGIDRVEVGDQVVRKSVSAEVNWGVRFVTQQQVEDFMQSLCDELHNRLLNENVKGQQLTMKIMRRAADVALDPPKHLGHGKCDVFNKSVVLGVATNDPGILSREAIATLKGFGFSPGELRGIGLQMTKLESINKGPLPGGQRRLQFRTAEKTAKTEDIDNPDVIQTPEKPKDAVVHQAAALTAASETAGTKPLNTFGSQFVLPTQIDPSVLAELPEDIRAKLSKGNKSSKKDKRQNVLEFTSRSISPAPAAIPPLQDIPSASQIDPETLDALPEDLRAEILAFYKPGEAAQSKDHSPQHTRQVRLPQSPHANRVIREPPKRLTPTKRGRGRPRGSRNSVQDTRSGLLQSNIVPAAASKTDEEEISEDFLAALPADLRDEVLAEHRRTRLRIHGGLDLPQITRHRAERPADPELLQLMDMKPRPPRPTFTGKNLSTMEELRDAMDSWVGALGSDGPEERDVEALGAYLRLVVLEEQEMAKAVQVVKWLEWILSNRGWQEDEEQASREWTEAIVAIKNAVTKAVTERGLPPPAF